jgi:hypothetical protein
MMAVLERKYINCGWIFKGVIRRVGVFIIVQRGQLSGGRGQEKSWMRYEPCVMRHES